MQRTSEAQPFWKARIPEGAAAAAFEGSGKGEERSVGELGLRPKESLAAAISNVFFVATETQANKINGKGGNRVNCVI